MLDLTDLHYFVTVAREGGITRAAEKLHRVQSNVTTRIKKLEAQLGCDLFLREGRRLILSAEGHRLLPEAEGLLAEAGRIEAAMVASEPGGMFRLGAMESTAAVRLPPVLERLGMAHPAIELELVTGNPAQLTARVLEGGLDAAFAAEPPVDARLDSVAAFDETVALVTLQDRLEPGTPLLVLERGCPHRARLEAWSAQAGWQPGRVIELGSYHAMFGCVLAGMGVALVPESVIQTFPEAARLVRHALPDSVQGLQTRLYWRRDGMSANTRALLAVMAG
ncbi:MAG: LysR family transcriptional regulator [Silicimonas sp.]|nr:LysR family transcriptional regulator [Silicimonas sp.]